MFESGYKTLFRFRGIPVAVHWSVIVLLVLAGGGFRFAPGAWAGVFAIILFHELGHGVLARRLGYYVSGVYIHGIGGVCRYHGDASRYDAARIAWGGVLGQALLMALATGPEKLAREFGDSHVRELFATLTVANFAIALLNLIPVAPLDGHLAWSLPRMVLERTRARRRGRRKVRTRRNDGSKVVRLDDWTKR